MCGAMETTENIIKEERYGGLRNQKVEIHPLDLGFDKTWKMLWNDERW